VRGFRAPYFSLTPATPWALDLLARNGFVYDASVYPGRNDRYGWPGAPRCPARLGDTGLLVFPVPLLSPRLPIGFSGGAYVRILPELVVRWEMRRQHKAGTPGMIYVHPWEIAPSLPSARSGSLRAELTRHACRRRMRPRLTRLLATEQHRLGTMADVLSALPDLPTWTR